MNENEAADALEGMYAEPAEAPAQAEAETQTPAAPAEPEVEPTQTGEPVAEGAEAPEATEEPEPSQPDEIDWTQFLPQATNVPAPVPDEDGQVDLDQLIQYQLNTKLAEQAQELRGWQQVSQILPEINTNPALREFVNNQRLAQVATGGDGDLVRAAEAVKALRGEGFTQGKSQAQASVTIQKAAALQGGQPAPAPAAPQNDALSNLQQTGSTSAAQDLFAGWIDQGLI